MTDYEAFLQEHRHCLDAREYTERIMRRELCLAVAKRQGVSYGWKKEESGLRRYIFTVGNILIEMLLIIVKFVYIKNFPVVTLDL